MEIDDNLVGEREARLERLVDEYRATQKRKLVEIARKLWLRTEREWAALPRHQPPPKVH
jgi:hypothetical protein